MTDYKTVEFDDGTEVTVKKDGDDVEAVKPLPERKEDLVEVPDETYEFGTHGLVDVDMEVFHELAERRDEDVTSVNVGTDELVEFAEELRDEWGRTTVELTVAKNQPVVADERGEPRDNSMVLMPRINGDSELY